MKKALIVHPDDNVANVIDDIVKGDAFELDMDDKKIVLKATSDIPFGFKVAVRDIPQGEAIVKYKQVIGKSSCQIFVGECVHIHNVEGTRGRGDCGGN